MPNRPNVVFLISDQHKQKIAGCYGDPLVQTPNIDRLAEGGRVFDAAFCQSPLCGPSRGSILTGAYPHTSGLWNHSQPVPIRYLPTLGHAFRRAGYNTGTLLPQNPVGFGQSGAGVPPACWENRLGACSTFQIQPDFAVIAGTIGKMHVKGEDAFRDLDKRLDEGWERPPADMFPGKLHKL